MILAVYRNTLNKSLILMLPSNDILLKRSEIWLILSIRQLQRRFLIDKLNHITIFQSSLCDTVFHSCYIPYPRENKWCCYSKQSIAKYFLKQIQFIYLRHCHILWDLFFYVHIQMYIHLQIKFRDARFVHPLYCVM